MKADACFGFRFFGLQSVTQGLAEQGFLEYFLKAQWFTVRPSAGCEGSVAAETSMVSMVNRGGNWLHNTFRLIVPSVLSKGQTSPLEFQAGQNAANSSSFSSDDVVPRGCDCNGPYFAYHANCVWEQTSGRFGLNLGKQSLATSPVD